MLIFYAPNVHRGGGLVLLKSLLEKLGNDSNVLFILDSRLPKKVKNSIESKVVYTRPSLLSRLKSEYMLKHKAKKQDVVLCFANQPPLFKLKCQKTIVFVQNRNVLKVNSLNDFNFRAKYRVWLERLWFKWRYKIVDEFIVQTESMKQNLQKIVGDKKITIAGFVPDLEFGKQDSPEKKYDFVYVSTADKHKQHWELIESWVILAEENIKPSLAITITEAENLVLFKFLQQSIDKYQLNITNLGHISHHQVMRLYQESKALVFPSTSESFGLPLIEAEKFGLPIIASERDFVRDVCQPVETFDPRSPRSIARAIKRYLSVANEILPLLSTDQFIKIIEN